MDGVPGRASAARPGRVYAICYDLTGASKDRLYDLVVGDWRRLVDQQKVTKDNRYLHHRGKPVVFVWGFFSDRFGPELAHRMIDFFRADGRYAATLVGGCPWQWRAVRRLGGGRGAPRVEGIIPRIDGTVAPARGR